MSEARDQVGEVFERYTHEVYGWAYRLLGRHHDALDVVQDVFVRWNNQCTQAPPRQPRGWLRKVTLNRALDIGRSRTARREADPDNLANIAAEPVLRFHSDQADLRRDVAARAGEFDGDAAGGAGSQGLRRTYFRPDRRGVGTGGLDGEDALPACRACGAYAA